ncbi:hypothetical protein MASR1M66_12950 [Aminivibrio sp.]
MAVSYGIGDALAVEWQDMAFSRTATMQSSIALTRVVRGLSNSHVHRSENADDREEPGENIRYGACPPSQAYPYPGR